MQKNLTDLPMNMTRDAIGAYLTEKDKLTLAGVSKATQGLFQPHRLQMMANKLLFQVMHDEEKKAEKILKLHPELLEITATAINTSGETLHTTAYRYVLMRPFDRSMCHMMLDCIPLNEQGERIKQSLVEQYNALAETGVKIKGFKMPRKKNPNLEFIKDGHLLVISSLQHLDKDIIRFLGVLERNNLFRVLSTHQYVFQDEYTFEDIIELIHQARAHNMSYNRILFILDLGYKMDAIRSGAYPLSALATVNEGIFYLALDYASCGVDENCTLQNIIDIHDYFSQNMSSQEIYDMLWERNNIQSILDELPHAHNVCGP